MKPRKTAKRIKIAWEFIKRRDRLTHPDGRTDNAGRWYPSKAERCPCCDSVRSPSRSYPWSYMQHCRTAEHVAQLHGQEPSTIRHIARQIEG